MTKMCMGDRHEALLGAEEPGVPGGPLRPARLVIEVDGAPSADLVAVGAVQIGPADMLDLVLSDHQVCAVRSQSS